MARLSPAAVAHVERIRIIDERTAHGVQVTWTFDPQDGSHLILVHDHARRDVFEIAPTAENARDAFHHPYCYPRVDEEQLPSPELTDTERQLLDAAAGETRARCVERLQLVLEQYKAGELFAHEYVDEVERILRGAGEDA